MRHPLRRKLVVDFVLTDARRGIYGIERRCFLFKKRGESMQHVVMKWLSYLLYFDDDLEIERSIGHRYKPDLVQLDPGGRVLTWIDCGSTAPEKLVRLARELKHCRLTIVKSHPGELTQYGRGLSNKIGPSENVEFLAFGDGMVDVLARLLRKKHRAVVVVSGYDGELFIELDGTPIRGKIERRMARDFAQVDE